MKNIGAKNLLLLLLLGSAGYYLYLKNKISKRTIKLSGIKPNLKTNEIIQNLKEPAPILAQVIPNPIKPIPNDKTIGRESEISLNLVNNTSFTQNINIMGSVTPPVYANNSTDLYQYDLSTEELSNLTFLEIQIGNTSSPTLVTYNVNIETNSISGIVEALNTLNQGIFSYSGTTVYAPSGYYIYGSLTVNTVIVSFVSTWNTANLKAGSSNADQIKLPLPSGGTYNFIVDWGDGNTDTIITWNQAETLHTYASSGTYTITITGVIIGFSFESYNAESNKILSVNTWGCFNLLNSVNGSYFNSCINLNLTSVSDKLNLIGITNLKSMFLGCTTLTTINNSNWDVSNVVDMSYMFKGCTNFNQDISTWDVSNVNTMLEMFYNAQAFNQPIGSWNVSNVTTMQNMFYFCIAFNQNISTWDVSSVNTMNGMFFNAQAFNQPIGSWNVGSVTNMSNMFLNNLAFNQPLNSWNVSSVNTMLGMFQDCALFNQPLNSWDVSNVTTMQVMFANATTFNGNIISWNVSNVNSMAQMFENCTAFNQNISAWNVSAVFNMTQMFSTASVFNQNISTWTVASCIDMSYMFYNAQAFNQPIGSWNVFGVVDMSFMFNDCFAFNQPIDTWNVSNVTNMTNFMTGKTTANYTLPKLTDIYNSWSLLTLKPNVTADFGTIQYTAGGSAGKAILQGAPNNWIITDGGI